MGQVPHAIVSIKWQTHSAQEQCDARTNWSHELGRGQLRSHGVARMAEDEYDARAEHEGDVALVHDKTRCYSRASSPPRPLALSLSLPLSLHLPLSPPLSLCRRHLTTSLCRRVGWRSVKAPVSSASLLALLHPAGHVSLGITHLDCLARGCAILRTHCIRKAASNVARGL